MKKSNLKVTRETELTGLPTSFFKNNRLRYIQKLKETLEGITDNTILFLKGGENPVRFDNDEDMHFFLQESNCYYLTGVREENYYFVINLNSEAKVTIFVPTPDETTKIFSLPPTLEEISKQYDAEAVELEPMTSLIAKMNPDKILVLNGINSDSNKPIYTCDYTFKEPYGYLNELVDSNELVYELLADCRTVKSDEEVDVIKFACDQAATAHKECIKSIEAGKTRERDLENTFWTRITELCFIRNHPYEMICATGENSATLHYIDNEATCQSGQLVLMDMGAKLCGYCSDITTTVPVSGTFTPDQASIYNIVLDANAAVKAKAKPGVSWVDCHLEAERVILEGLQNLKILKTGFTVEEMRSNRVAYYFMPHGVGHFLGLECHDVGGYLSWTTPRSEELGLSSLRTARTLVKGNVITCEPGIYFIPFLLEMAFKDEKVSKYIDENETRKYFTFGGVRIEDDLLISDDGCVCLTEGLPRTVADIEEFMKK